MVAAQLMFNLFLYVNLYTCIALVGLIWVIQLVHYPSFHFVDKSNFAQFESFHSLRISIVVIPLMLLELISSLALLYYAPKKLMLPIVVALFFVLLVWAITFFVSSPIHGKLLSDYDKELIDKLISTNWWRTILWTLKSFLLIYILKAV